MPVSQQSLQCKYTDFIYLAIVLPSTSCTAQRKFSFLQTSPATPHKKKRSPRQTDLLSLPANKGRVRRSTQPAKGLTCGFCCTFLLVTPHLALVPTLLHPNTPLFQKP